MLRFDNLGLGDSDGDWGDGSFSHKVADTAQAATVHEQVRSPPCGSWWGIHSAARRSSRRPTTWCPVRAVASIGAPSEPGTWNTTTTRWWNGSSPTGRRPFANASKIFRAARHPRSFVSLEGADHLLTGRKQAKGRPGSSARRPIPTWPTSWLRFSLWPTWARLATTQRPAVRWPAGWPRPYAVDGVLDAGQRGDRSAPRPPRTSPTTNAGAGSTPPPTMAASRCTSSGPRSNAPQCGSSSFGSVRGRGTPRWPRSWAWRTCSTTDRGLRGPVRPRTWP